MFDMVMSFADVGIQHGRVFHDLLPVVRPQPGEVVLAGNAVGLKGEGARCGARGKGVLFHGSEVRFLSLEGKGQYCLGGWVFPLPGNPVVLSDKSGDPQKSLTFFRRSRT